MLIQNVVNTTAKKFWKYFMSKKVEAFLEYSYCVKYNLSEQFKKTF